MKYEIHLTEQDDEVIFETDNLPLAKDRFLHFVNLSNEETGPYGGESFELVENDTIIDTHIGWLHRESFC